MMGEGMGYGAYLRFLDDIAMSDVWIFNNLNQITRGHVAAAVPIIAYKGSAHVSHYLQGWYHLAVGVKYLSLVVQVKKTRQS